MQPNKAKSIRAKIQWIANGNFDGLNIKYFASQDVFRLRVGQFRAIYKIINNEIVLIVIAVGAKGDIYK
jgi:mRNA interferase RelE/StbE